jgi:amidase
VADCAALLGAIAGADGRDPTALAAAVPDYLGALDGDLRDLRIGFDEAWACDGVDGEIVRALREALAVFDTAGATLVPVRMPATAEVVSAWFPLCTAEAAAAHSATFPARAGDYGPELAGLLDNGRAATAVDYAQAHERRLLFRGELGRVFATVDCVLAPACLRQNFTLAEFARFGSRPEDWPELIRYTAPFDISGTPTLSLPAGCNADGAPYGFQLLGGVLGEAALLRAGHAWQQATEFHRLRPS